MDIFASEININRNEDGQKRVAVRLQNIGGWSADNRLDAYVTLEPEEIQGVNILDDEKIERISRQKLANILAPEAVAYDVEPEEAFSTPEETQTVEINDEAIRDYFNRLREELINNFNLANREENTVATESVENTIDTEAENTKQEFDVADDTEFNEGVEELKDRTTDEGDTTTINQDKVNGVVEGLKGLIAKRFNEETGD